MKHTTRTTARIAMLTLGVALMFGAPVPAAITDDVPMEDPSVAAESRAEHLHGNVEHTDDEVVNIFADAGKIESIAEPAAEPGTPDVPDEGRTGDRSALSRQDAGIYGCILRIRTGYQFEDGSFAEWANGTGILVGKDCILTTRSVAVISQKSTLYNNILATQRSAYLDQGIDLLDFSAVKKNVVTYAIADQGNVRCRIEENAGDNSLAILYPEQRINAYGTVTFAAEAPSIGDEVYAVGTVNEDVEKPLLAEDFFTRTAEMVETRKSGSLDFIEFDGVFDGLPSGCPLVDGQQHVTGLITDGSAGRGSAVNLNSIRSVLDKANVEYLVDGEDKTADIERLRALLDEANETDLSDCTAETAAALREAVDAATALAEEDSPSRNRVEAEAKNLQDALDGLERIDHSGKKTQKFVMLAVILAVLAAAVLILPKQLRRIGKESWEFEEEEEARKSKKKEKKQEKKQEKKKEREGPEEPEDPYAAEDDDNGETTVLRESSANARLRCLGTGEVVEIKGKNFMIGRGSGADLRLADNDNVSREHCRIRHRGEDYYVVDMNSVNGTFIDGDALEPGEQRRIENGQTLKAADEEFLFIQ